jgi:hypothetical protein
MNACLKITFSCSLLICLNTVAWGQTNNIIEAEADPKGAVVSDSSASGGKFVTSDRAYQPLMITALPAGDAFTVWVKGNCL